MDSASNVYVADHGHHRVQKFTAQGDFLLKWGSEGTDDGQFKGVFAVAVDGEGSVYVADQNNGRIQKFTSQGEFLLKWGGKGDEEGQFHIIRDIAVDGAGTVYVVDEESHRIQKFSSQGVFSGCWGPRYCYVGGAPSGEDGRLAYPSGIAVDNAGNVYVADPGNNRIQKFPSQGEFLLKWES